MLAPADFEARLSASFPAAQWGEAGVIVAYSAGPDSTALLAGLASLRDRADDDVVRRGGLVAAHFNHRLRGSESDADEAHAVATCAGLEVECVVGRADEAALAAEQGDGVEAAAREARYRFLVDVALGRGLRYIATGHTLDDQAETVLHRLVRGTGIVGLGGIPRARALADDTIGLVRPLLGFRRAEVNDYLQSRGIEFRVDASNDDVAFTRNRLRHELLPLLTRDYNPQIVEALARLATQADELSDVVAELVEPLLVKSLRRADAATCELDCAPLLAVPRYLQRTVLVAAWQQCGWPQQAMGYDEWDALATMIADAAAPKRMFPGGVTAERAGDALRLFRPKRNQFPN
jgi:tRNA(Ile)-lysidine synthase